MTEQEYREIKVSPIQLIIIFLGLIIVGVVIFLLGVSVGKKQVQPQKIPAEIVTEKRPKEAERETKLREEASKNIREERSLPVTMEKKSLYYIQVGAFKSRDSATKIANRFISLGYKAFILEPFIEDKTPIYRVRIGGFISEKEALKVKEELESLEKKKYFIVKQ
ncbi:SPOR domain-containing protein [Candidatus Aminicenantes bacterium AC-708-M15]|jgi:cell division septation protein DedD|nr:SPOR domain-containing protein [SCandidatus Aminicenantes bacterium Aminicenantia_JdfR_composite]MCP2597657.1 SPOR domain-containing protein [Candidatus Aminicenantes bacterium AC-335-G13]MCP2598817.1 SPOR domain-containing protein [Candidatus Aminicenantes bacterium AC-335-L06]MCP2604154.1 SPOR domain-containing protein [Candidatus Aminicenantes bacterium AC-708-M15]MCP2617939.1 SPOR domain-containing protein [Candidatus Aminicenantes bacterium AC-335-A11]